MSMSDGRYGLEGRRTVLEIDPQEFAAIGHRLVDDVASLLGELRTRRLGPDDTPDVLRERLGAERGLPDEGAGAAELVAEATKLLVEHSVFNGHPRFFGYITAGAAPIGVLAELLAAGVNPNLGGWSLSPMASEIEAQTVRWIAELVGFPAGGGGILVSGGNMANMLGFWAARAAVAGWDVRESGLRGEGARALRTYASKGTHTWIQKAADLSGLGAQGIRWIDTDTHGRMDLSALEARIAADISSGDHPFVVVGTAGSVSTGAVDPLPAIRKLCDDYGLWFHVDGAYGAFAAAAPNAPGDLKGLALADSVALDPHKWLYAPLEVGCTLVREPDGLLRAFSYRPEYYHLEQDVINYFEHGVQNSRGFRALKVWLQLRQAGRAGYARMIAEDIELAKRFHQVAGEHPELEALTHALSITTYRFVPQDLADRKDDETVAAYLNELNERIQVRMEKGGQAFVSNAVLDDGVYALRMCIVNFRTTLEDVRALADITAELGRAVDAEMRPATLAS